MPQPPITVLVPFEKLGAIGVAIRDETATLLPRRDALHPTARAGS